jgi:hypothetical protein
VEQHQRGRTRSGVDAIDVDEITVGRLPALAPQARPAAGRSQRCVDRLQVAAGQPARGAKSAQRIGSA